jgi:hypothetical protein
MHKWYIFLLNILLLHVSVTFDHHQGACLTEYHNFTVCAIFIHYITDFLHILTRTFNVLIPIINIQHDGLDLDNIFIYNCISDDCTYCKIIVLLNASTLMMVESDGNM